MIETITIRPFDIRAADDQTYAALHALHSRLRAERLPDDPPRSFDESIAEWQSIPPMVSTWAWVARDGASGRIVGSILLFAIQSETNQHMGQVDLGVDPAFRRQGIGSRLLHAVATTAEQEGRRLLISVVSDRVPAGTAFAERVGGRPGLATHTSQLDLAGLNRDMIADWLERAPADFELGLWDGPYPESDLAAIADLMKVMNQAPRDDLEVEDIDWTPELVRQMEQFQLAGGKQRWTMYVREKRTGDFAGFTELQLNPERPTILLQGNTGILPDFRRRGLGRWLKAAMLQKVLAEWPPARFIRTGNADTNASMLKINRELGFEPYAAEVVWQVDTERVLAYLTGIAQGDPL